MAPLAQSLAQDFRVISYQLRGEDDCFALRRRFDLADLVSDLREFLDWCKLEKPTVLGVSFGGVLALELAARWPGRISSLVLQGTGVRFERGLLQQIASVVLSGYPLPSDSPFVNQFFNLLFGGKQRPGPLFDFVTRQCWQTDQAVMAHRFALVERFDMRGRLDRIQARSLLLAGERDLLVSEESLLALRDGIPQASEVILPRTGHLAAVTHPEVIAKEVNEFLSR
jgi:pimeloyl-ACP methyl ester carboxylesterase